MNKTVFPSVAGILAIIAALLCAYIGVLFIEAVVLHSIAHVQYYGLTYHYYETLVTGIFGILGCAFGMLSGRSSLRKRHFALSVTGLCLVTLSGIIIFFGLRAAREEVQRSLLASLSSPGLPIIILAIISLIFVALSKQEFS